MVLQILNLNSIILNIDLCPSQARWSTQIIIRAMSEAAWSQRLLLARPGRAEVRFSGSSSNTHFHLSLCSLSRLAHHSSFYDPAGRWLWKHPRPGPGSQSVSGNLSHCSVLHDSGGGRLPILNPAVILRHRDERRRGVWQARAEEQDGDRDAVTCGGSRPRQEGKQILIVLKDDIILMIL